MIGMHENSKESQIFYHKDIPHALISKHKELLLRVLNKETTRGANVEKLKGSGGYCSIRINKWGRIIFKSAILNGIERLVVLEIKENHEY